MKTCKDGFCCNLKYYLKQKKMTKEELSELTGISVKTLKRYENAQAWPKISTAYVIAEALQVEIGQIWLFHS